MRLVLTSKQQSPPRPVRLNFQPRPRTPTHIRLTRDAPRGGWGVVRCRCRTTRRGAKTQLLARAPPSGWGEQRGWSTTKQWWERDCANVPPRCGAPVLEFLDATRCCLTTSACSVVARPVYLWTPCLLAPSPRTLVVLLMSDLI